MIQGSCLCKTVTYQVEEDVTELFFCHCSYCRKATASAYSVNAKISKENFRLLSGEETLTTYQSSVGKMRYYCSKCHSQIFHLQDSHPNQITLKMGTVDTADQNLESVPVRHIFEDSSFTWLGIGATKENP